MSGSEKLKVEKEGWESEVGLLRGELEEVKAKLEETTLAKVQVEQEKKVEVERRAKGKLLVERLRLELKSRKAKEKWEAAIMDLEDSEREKAEVTREFEENMAKCERVILDCEIQELEVSSLQAYAPTQLIRRSYSWPLLLRVQSSLHSALRTLSSLPTALLILLRSLLSSSSYRLSNPNLLRRERMLRKRLLRKLRSRSELKSSRGKSMMFKM